MGEKIFAGKGGSLDGEARLIDMKAQMDKIRRIVQDRRPIRREAPPDAVRHRPGDRESPPPAVSGKVDITGPDKASSSKVTLVVYGGAHRRGRRMPTPGSNTFKGGDRIRREEGSAAFSYTLK